jgi:hypothetical protein
MKKTTLLKDLFEGYEINLGSPEYEELKKSVIEHAKSFKADDSAQLAESILRNYPEFGIMHQAFMRFKIGKIRSDVNTIKVIVVISFFASLVAGIIIASQIK